MVNVEDIDQIPERLWMVRKVEPGENRRGGLGAIERVGSVGLWT